MSAGVPLRGRAGERLGVCCLLGALVLTGPLAAQDPQAALAQHLQQAQVHLDNERYAQAVEELEEAIRIQPQLPGAYYQLGMAHWHLGHMAPAEQAFKKELEFEPPDAYSLYYLGRIRLSEGKIDEAIHWFEQVLQIGTVLDVRRRLASAYLSTERTHDAIILLEDSIKARPELGELHYLLGRAYQKKGNKADAQREFELAEKWKNKQQNEIRGLLQLRTLLKEKKTGEAMSLAEKLRQSGDADVLLSTGMALGQSGMHREALPILEQVVEVQPSYAEAYYNLAVGRVSLQEMPQAVPLLEKAVELRPEFYEAQMLLGTVLVQLGQSETAIGHLRTAAEIRPENARLQAFLGLQYLQERYYTEAIKTLQKATELDPKNPDLRYLLVQAHFRNHDFEEALKEARTTLELFPDQPRSHFQVATQLDNMGRFQEAQRHLEDTLAIDPTFFEAKLLLGEVLLKLGQAEASIPYFRDALAQQSDLSYAYAGLGKALIQLKRYEETETEMQKAIRIDPELAPLRLYLSQAYRALGKMEEAKKEAAIFTRLNRERAEKRDQDVEREYSP